MDILAILGDFGWSNFIELFNKDYYFLSLGLTRFDRALRNIWGKLFGLEDSNISSGVSNYINSTDCEYILDYLDGINVIF